MGGRQGQGRGAGRSPRIRRGAGEGAGAGQNKTPPGKPGGVNSELGVLGLANCRTFDFPKTFYLPRGDKTITQPLG